MPKALEDEHKSGQSGIHPNPDTRHRLPPTPPSLPGQFPLGLRA